MGNNPASMMKSMRDMVSMTTGVVGGGNDKDSPSEKLPDGEKYFGFVNVRRN